MLTSFRVVNQGVSLRSVHQLKVLGTGLTINAFLRHVTKQIADCSWCLLTSTTLLARESRVNAHQNPHRPRFQVL